jgi:hypothetical protein
MNIILVIFSNFCQTAQAELLLSETYGKKVAEIEELNALTNGGILRFMNDHSGPRNPSKILFMCAVLGDHL